jgi:hypothetical protein
MSVILSLSGVKQTLATARTDPRGDPADLPGKCRKLASQDDAVGEQRNSRQYTIVSRPADIAR